MTEPLLARWGQLVHRQDLLHGEVSDLQFDYEDAGSRRRDRQCI